MAKMQVVIVAYDENGDSLGEPIYKDRVRVSKEEMPSFIAAMCALKRGWDNRPKGNTSRRVPK
jgi:hypothetical protein